MSHNKSLYENHPSSEDPFATRLNVQQPKALDSIDSSPNVIVLQESLLFSINLHVLRRVCASSSKKDFSFSFQQSFYRVNRISKFIHKIGYVSTIFFETACVAVQVFLGTHLFTVRWPENLSKLATFASFFNSEIHSLDLEVSDPSQGNKLFSYSYDFFNPKGPLFLTNLRQLSLGFFSTGALNPTGSNEAFHYGTVKFILQSPTIETLDILIYTPREAKLLTKIFSSSKCRLRKFSFNTSGSRELDVHCLAPMFNAVANCNSMQEVRLFDTNITFEVLASLFNSSSIKKLTAFEFTYPNAVPSVPAPLKCNSSLQELSMMNIDCNPNDIADVLQHNTALKRLEVTISESSFSPIFKFLESNTSLKELIVRGFCNRKTFESEEFEALCKMMRINKSLLILNFPGHLMTSTLFQLFVISFKNNHVIKKVVLPDSSKSLSSFVSDCETVCTKQLPFSVDFDPHFIDVNKKVFCFSPEYSSWITTVEVSSLQSFVNRFGIKELTLKNCIFTEESTTVLSNLIRKNNSMTSVDFSHCKLNENSVSNLINAIRSNFSLKTVNFSGIDGGFKTILAVFKEFSTHQLRPTLHVDPHRIDFSTGTIFYDELAPDDLISLMDSLHSNLPIKRVDCRTLNNQNLEAIITLFKLLSLKKSVIDIDISPHFIDVKNGVFSFTQQFFLK
ncbi:hypothetical protein GEMRC1_009616 [Eukaryota sp. GEM-RC1]